MKNFKKDFIPLLIALILIGTSIGITTLTNYKIGYKLYLGIILLAVSIILYFKNKKLYQYIFGLTLLIASTNLIDFFYINVVLYLGPIGINPINLILLIIFLTLNKNIIDQLFPEPKKAESNEADQQQKLEIKINRFEQKFANKTETELKQITDLNNAYVEEARIAAKRILTRNEYAPQQRL
ncbi:hypothetical protein LB467_18255 [Salegentibacter sp. JZCK2]|uniref:hypothetical protein n=1 Tax=Salegentibacter tibetensis TaxID=2873600 RepID=UPI001CCAF0C0|nr:hypothetical protein [Salegentibacter tibetensis]MBZ9731633.1 hypothetical protein [Salegentibacter tibetensis]